MKDLEAPTRGRDLHVIVAEDDPDQRALLASVLSDAGYLVTQVKDGEALWDALVMSRPHFFSLAIVDHGMPHLLGTEVLARAARRVPFVLMTGAPDPALRELAARLGAAAFLEKPVSLAELLRTVDRTILAESGGEPTAHG